MPFPSLIRVLISGDLVALVTENLFYLNAISYSRSRSLGSCKFCLWDTSGPQCVCVILITIVVNKYLSSGGSDVNILFLLAWLSQGDAGLCRVNRNVSFITD